MLKYLKKHIRFPYLFSIRKQKKKKNRPNKFRRHKFSVNHLRLSYSTTNFKPLILNESTNTIVSMKVKRSLRWYPTSFDLYKAVYPINYIDSKGFVTNHTFAYWYTDFRNILTTKISTIFNRLTRRFQRLFNDKFCFLHWRELVACATIYSFNENIHFLTRSIFLLKTLRFRDFRFFLYDRLKRLDNNTRFVCCQALKQADWLSSRSTNVGRKSRDKSFKYPLFDFRKYEFLEHKYTSDIALNGLIRSYLKDKTLTLDLSVFKDLKANESLKRCSVPF
jgi:hypothetical protein